VRIDNRTGKQIIINIGPERDPEPAATIAIPHGEDKEINIELSWNRMVIN